VTYSPWTIKPTIHNIGTSMTRKEDPKIIFGERLRTLRQKASLSQEALADAAGLDRTYISSCERGKRNISLLNIWRLAKALSIPPEDFFKTEK
jgi:transcriptional regulator with XRE-family HTH domain